MWRSEYDIKYDMPYAVKVVKNNDKSENDITALGRPKLKLKKAVRRPQKLHALDLPVVQSRPPADLAPERRGRVDRPARTRYAARKRRLAALAPGGWSVARVMDRIEEGYTTLGRLPMRVWPKAYGNAMPGYFHEHADLVGQVATGELERTLLERNDYKLRGATSGEIARMEQALAWPMEFLRDRPELARSVCLNALWAVLKKDPRKMCIKRGIDPKAHREQWLAGVQIIAEQLARRKLPVA